MLCPNCGNELTVGTAFCPRCGTNINGETQPQYNFYGVNLSSPKSGWGIAAIAFGLLSPIAGLFGAGVIFAVIGIILGIIGVKKANGNRIPSVMAVIGIVISIIALGLNLLFIVICSGFSLIFNIFS